MIEIIPTEVGYITKSIGYYVFIDDIFVGHADKDFVINPEYQTFLLEYETFDKQKRNSVNCPVKYLFNGYKACTLFGGGWHFSKTEEDLEKFFRFATSKEEVLKNVSI